MLEMQSMLINRSEGSALHTVAGKRLDGAMSIAQRLARQAAIQLDWKVDGYSCHVMLSRHFYSSAP